MNDLLFTPHIFLSNSLRFLLYYPLEIVDGAPFGEGEEKDPGLCSHGEEGSNLFLRMQAEDVQPYVQWPASTHHDSPTRIYAHCCASR